MRRLLQGAYFLAFGLALLHGTVVAVRWWQGDVLARWEQGLLLAWPLLLVVFVTRHSIFRRDCPRCRRE